ncbi:Secretory phospholipase A2 receptor [Stylophora pistillata]|uniref:Secretory phospholipase A2 receptor n=1 Tax=Stylophora pistillata TaxID=50429 RepID=A0A2B4R8J3_STYPI|nr:Secretory phospholipase A2 receptor [Stylophora pistillata]
MQYWRIACQSAWGCYGEIGHVINSYKTPSVQQSWCPSGWYRLKSSCVFIGKNPARLDLNDEDGVTPWRKAREKCNEKGADLMIVRDKADLKGLLSMYYETGVILRRPLFLGSREDFNPRWKWLDETEVDPALWGNGEPKIVHRRCGVVENFGKRLFDRGCGWWLATKPCDKIRRAFICESPLTNRTCQQGYSVGEDRCYKIVTTPRLVWEDAQWDCSTENSSLAVINTKEKLESVASLLATVKWPSSFFVGLVRNLSSWSWLDGASVDVSLFQTGYPKIRDREENCIAFSGYTPDIKNAGCNNAYSYACQSAQAIIANVAFGSVTDHSSLATGSISSFAVDDNLTTCFFSEVVRE